MKLMLLLTVNTRTVFPPLMVTAWPEASKVVFVVMVFVLATVIVPLQAKVTVPPPASALVKSLSVKLTTTPPACPASGKPSTPIEMAIQQTTLRSKNPTRIFKFSLFMGEISRGWNRLWERRL